MGFRFNLEAANWLAHVLAPTGVAAPPPPEGIEYGLDDFLGRLERDFYAGPGHVRDLMQRLRMVRDRIRRQPVGPWAVQPLSDYFARLPWCALLVPELGDRSPQWMNEVRTLRHLVNLREDDPGLLLQVEGEFSDAVSLTNIFPALRVATRSLHLWPGVLIWTPRGDAVFLSVPSSEARGMEHVEWIFSHLAAMPGTPDLALLQRQYEKHFANQLTATAVRLLHVSDLHLGCPEATLRLPRVQSLLATLIDSLSADGSKVQAVVTGDLMDTPSSENLDHVRAFLHNLQHLTSQKPFVVLGNHDVRDDGWMLPNLGQVMGIETDRVRVVPEGRLILVGFNSALGGALARGRIGERGFQDAGNAMDGIKGAAEFTKFAVLHHHPTPVERPDWHRRKWYERLLGDRFEATEELEDSGAFLAWARARGIAATLHGHKHIPRVDTTNGMTVVGCGSTVGKVDTKIVGETYMSVNVVTVVPDRDTLTVRLAAERIPGGGLRDELQHEMIYRKPSTHE